VALCGRPVPGAQRPAPGAQRPVYGAAGAHPGNSLLAASPLGPIIRLVARNRRLDLGKLLLALPTLFTLASTFCGFYSMLIAAHAETATDFLAAVWMLGFAAVLDGVDGRVARWTKTESEFGEQLDSLSDMIAFGAAPAWLLYHWGLFELGPFGFVVSFVFVAAVAIRLARFTATQEEEYDRNFFIGLPCPMAAMLLVTAVGVYTGFYGVDHATGPAQLLVASALVIVGLLMVSNLRFRSHRSLKRGRKTLVRLVLVLVAVTYISLVTRLEVGLLFFCLTYMAYHMAVWSLNLERRIASRLSNRHGDSIVDLMLDDDVDEEDDLAPLG
jgi:CDP-diacylglycerol--serine O-phosphatidyltransferase